MYKYFDVPSHSENKAVINTKTFVKDWFKILDGQDLDGYVEEMEDGDLDLDDLLDVSDLAIKGQDKVIQENIEKAMTVIEEKKQEDESFGKA